MKTFRKAATVTLAIVVGTLLVGPVYATNVHSVSYKQFSGSQFSERVHPLAIKIGNIFENHFDGNSLPPNSIFGVLKDRLEDRAGDPTRQLELAFKHHRGDHKQVGIPAWLLERHPALSTFEGFPSNNGLDGIYGESGEHQPGSESSVVPIPAAAWLMFSALSVLAWRGRQAGAKNGEAEAA